MLGNVHYLSFLFCNHIYIYIYIYFSNGLESKERFRHSSVGRSTPLSFSNELSPSYSFTPSRFLRIRMVPTKSTLTLKLYFDTWYLGLDGYVHDPLEFVLIYIIIVNSLLLMSLIKDY